MDNLIPLCPTDFLELSTALKTRKKEEFSIKKNSSKKDSAIFMKKIKSPKSPSMDRRSRLLKRLLLLHIPGFYIFHPTYVHISGGLQRVQNQLDFTMKYKHIKGNVCILWTELNCFFRQIIRLGEFFPRKVKAVLRFTRFFYQIP